MGAPTTIVINNKSDLWELYALAPNDPDTPLTIDIRSYGFFSPMDIVLLSQLIIQSVQKDYSVYVLGHFEGKQRYLTDIGLPDFCLANYREPKTMQFIQSQTAMPIKRLESSTMTQYIHMAQSFIGSMCPGKYLGSLDIGISELINNVENHSESKIGAYVFCQYYPTRKLVKFAVSDAGVGIPKKVAKFLRDNGETRINKRGCIDWAFQEKKSIKSTPRNAGLGLYNIMNFITSNNGRLSLLSDEVCMVSIGGHNMYSRNPIKHFHGTVVEIEIVVDNLPYADEEFGDFEI